MFVPVLAPAMWAINTAISAYTAVDTGNVAGFFGGMIGGIVGGGLGLGVADAFAGALGQSSFSFLGGAIIGAGEFGMSGLGSGFGGALAGGGSFRDAIKAGGMGAAIGAATGAVIEGSYLAGWQKGLHGRSKEEILNALKNYGTSIFEGSQIGAGAGGKVKVGAGPVKLEAGMHAIEGYRIVEGGVERFSEEYTGLTGKLGRLGLEASVEDGQKKLGLIIDFNKAELKDFTTIEMGGTVPVSVDGSKAVNAEVNIHLDRIFDIRRHFK